MWFIGVDVEQETSAPPPKKKILDPPLIGYRKATQIGLGTDLRRLQTSPKLLRGCSSPGYIQCQNVTVCYEGLISFYI